MALNALETSLNKLGIPDHNVPPQYSKGRYLFQPTTDRWFTYTRFLAGREDMLLYYDGRVMDNPLKGSNRSNHSLNTKPAIPLDAATQAYQEQTEREASDLARQLKASQQEASRTKATLLNLQAQVDALTKAQINIPPVPVPTVAKPKK